jgi:Zn-dependent protease
MNNLTNGSFRLFRVAGITVFLHWTWLLVAYFDIYQRVNHYHSMAWNVAEYLSIFAIVLMHEFGHAFACRQVGGTAERIVLWPLGGVAFVNPPPRPAALLWSIAAGPLVNVILVPITIGLYIAARMTNLAPEAPDPLAPGDQTPDLLRFLFAVGLINAVLLFYNILPIYPLDGGQIVRALLWFLIGPARSLMAASIIGLVGGIGLAALAVVTQSRWGLLMAAFIGWQSVSGFLQGLRLHRIQPGVDCLNRALAYLQDRDTGQAIRECDQAIEMLRSQPQLLGLAYQRRGTAYMMANDLEQAVADYSEARRLLPTSAEVLSNRAQAFSRLGKYGQGRADLEEALHLNPNSAGAMNNLAWLMATCPQQEFRDGKNAVTLATRACELSNWQTATFMGTLGAAYAEIGRMSDAIAMQNKALESAKYRKDHGELSAHRLRLYQAGQPYRAEQPDPVALLVKRPPTGADQA